MERPRLTLFEWPSFRSHDVVVFEEFFAPPAGLEPAPPASEAGALSAELRGRPVHTNGGPHEVMKVSGIADTRCRLKRRTDE